MSGRFAFGAVLVLIFLCVAPLALSADDFLSMLPSLQSGDAK